jgi:hypothetical protein
MILLLWALIVLPASLTDLNYLLVSRTIVVSLWIEPWRNINNVYHRLLPDVLDSTWDVLHSILDKLRFSDFRLLAEATTTAPNQ